MVYLKPFGKIYKKIDPQEIKVHLLIYGDISGSCANCDAVDLKLDLAQCPRCHAEFRYISFRNIRNHLPKVHKLIAQKPQMVIVDFEDYKRNLGSTKAHEFLK